MIGGKNRLFRAHVISSASISHSKCIIAVVGSWNAVRGVLENNGTKTGGKMMGPVLKADVFMVVD